jgi:RHS repeat-associated protein
VYDGEGRRVQKIETSGTTSTYVYDAMGSLAAEYTTGAAAASGTQYLTADHLGSTRMMTGGPGSPSSQTVFHDYQPFGYEIPAGIDGRGPSYGEIDDPRQKFTGKERDSETGLDYFGARYFSAALGRFTSPDPSPMGIALGDPQSWNLYSYVRNRPTRFVDVGGNWATNVHEDIVTFALQGYMSAGEIRELVSRQYAMDADQSDQHKHFMQNPTGDSAANATSAAWRFVGDQLLAAYQNVGANGTLNKAGLDALGDALHTVQDYTSPMHTDADFSPMVWRGGWWPPSKMDQAMLM